MFGPVYSHVVLRPWPGYVPKVPTTPFRDQVVNLQALPSEEADPALALLCPVRALRIYVTRTRSVRSSEQLFVCHGRQQKGKAVSKQRSAHWIVEAVTLAYQSQGEPCPLRVRAHSTRSIASSHALAHYLQQRCTQWSRWAPRLANLHWSGRKVATSCMAFVCHALACQHLHATRL